MFLRRFGRRTVLLRFLSLTLAIGMIGLLFSYLGGRISPIFSLPTETELPSPTPRTVVIDAGHGGEDGGAVSATGVREKDINLRIAMLLCEMLKERGVPVVMTRTEDTLLYDRNVDYQGRKKALDLAARRTIAENSGNCIFVSIHLNAFPQSQYRGLQVWYSPNHEDSAKLASCIQQTVAKSLQPDNHRTIKRATSAIYLLHHLHCPAVLVECGFLSNPEEAVLLNTEDYQRELASVLLSAIMEEEWSA